MHPKVKFYVSIFLFSAGALVIANVLVFLIVNQTGKIPNPDKRTAIAKVDFDRITGPPDFMKKWKTWNELPESQKRDWLSEPKFEGLEDYLNLFAISDSEISAEEFENWDVHNSSYTSKENRVPIPENKIKFLQTETVVFDCHPYVLNDDLKSAIQNAPKLLWLRLSNEFQEKDLELLKGLKHLKGLGLNEVRLKNGDLRWLSRFEDLKWLELEPGVVNNLKLPRLPKLQFLNLTGIGISDKHLPSANQFPNLKNLELSSSKVSDDGIAQIAKHCPRLESLNLGWCEDITYDSVKSLAKLKELRYLDANHTTLEWQVRSEYGSETGTIPELQIKLPNCHIQICDR